VQLISPPSHKASSSTGATQCARELLDVLPPVIWFIRKRMRSFRRGLSLPQFRALVFIDAQPDASLSACADHLGASKPTTSRIVAGLVRRGLLARCGCPDDRRQMELSLTARGREVLHAARGGTQELLAEALVGLSASQQQTLVQATEILGGIFGSVSHGARADVCSPGNGSQGS
jgi:DNA-binding MarR family transcriptional regulator